MAVDRASSRERVGRIRDSIHEITAGIKRVRVDINLTPAGVSQHEVTVSRMHTAMPFFSNITYNSRASSAVMRARGGEGSSLPACGITLARGQVYVATVSMARTAWQSCSGDRPELGRGPL